MFTRREMFQTTARMGAAATLPLLANSTLARESVENEVNDAQSRLNPTQVHSILRPTTVEQIQGALREVHNSGRAISMAGGRHAMGGQQFGRDTVLLDMNQFSRVTSLDQEDGRIEVEAGIQWPELIDFLHRQQVDANKPWAIRQKQTGVDRVSIGGSLASNIHGRGLRFPPLISDIESLVLLDAQGKLQTCSRRENAELFSLAIGGYGMFGVITHVTLRLVPRTKVQRVVEVIAVKDLLPRVEDRLQNGYVYGDCQYSPDLTTDAAAHPGLFSCYRPVAEDMHVSKGQRHLSVADWAQLYSLARTDKKKAFERYSQHYLASSGQVYGSDTQQLSNAFEGYRDAVDEKRDTEMITEVYVTKEAFNPFMSQVRKDFLKHEVDLTYGTIRFIEKDSESFLAWATDSLVCIVCNLHVVHTEEGKRKAIADFRRIIDRVIEHGGHYYLTYHRWATRKQVETCYPQFVEFLRLKKKYDPQERFQSNWYRHYKRMFADVI
ncbi:MAG: FAD-binding protein [Aeoliella sp.]